MRSVPQASQFVAHYSLFGRSIHDHRLRQAARAENPGRRAELRSRRTACSTRSASGSAIDPTERGRARRSSTRRTSSCCRPWRWCSAIRASGRSDLDTGIDWVKRRGRRAGPRAASAARAARHRRTASTRVVEIVDKGAGQGRDRLFRAHHRRPGERRAHRHHRCRPRSAAATAASAGRRASSRRCMRSRSARPISSATCRRGPRWR